MRKLTGIVVSNRMQKTVVVRVDRLQKHPKYRKLYRTSAKYKAHAEDAASFRPGDVVEIREARPLSKEKRWRVVQIVKKVAVPAEAVSEADAQAEG